MEKVPESENEVINTLGITSELVKNVRNALNEADDAYILDIVSQLYAADVADLIEQLPSSKRQELINIIRPQLDPEILTELEESTREEVIEHLSPKEVAAALTSMDSDDAVYILEDLDDEQQQEILKEIPVEDRAAIEKSLSYPEGSAGRFMQSSVTVEKGWTIGRLIDQIELNQDLPERFYTIFVIDEEMKPIGSISLDSLFRYQRRTSVEEIMEINPIKIPVYMDQEEIAYIFQQYGLFSAPVIDQSGKIIGTISINDIVYIVREETEDDLLKLGGVSEYNINDTVIQTSWLRLQWLLVTFVNTLIAASVISHFEPVLTHTVALAFLMPIVAAMGGNAGMQVVTVTVRALANRDILQGHFWQTLGRELFVASINGTVLATLLASIATIWFDSLKIGIILGTALIFNILWSAIAGITFPILLSRLGMDPAISSGPLLTTTTDVFGFAFFLGLATFFLL